MAIIDTDFHMSAPKGLTAATGMDALTHAIDRDTLVEDFYRGFARSASLPASPLFPYYSQNLADRYKFDDLKFLEAVKGAGVEGATVVFLGNSADSLRLRVAPPHHP